MSDPLSHRNSVKRRLEEIDDTLENLTRSFQDMSDFSLKAKLEHRMTSIRLKRDKTQALVAVARSQNILAEMEILIAQNEVDHEVEKLKCFKRTKLDNNNNINEGTSPIQQNTQARADKACQTKKSSSKIKPKKSNDDKKKTARNSSQPSKDYNKNPDPLAVPNSSEIRNKMFENGTPNSNSLFEIKNKSNNPQFKNKTYEKRTPNSNSLFETKNTSNSSEFKKKSFENRTPQNPTSQEIKNKLSSNNNLNEAKMTKKDDILFKMPMNGQKTAHRTETQPETVSRHSLPAVISQPRYRNRPETPIFNTGTPDKIYGNKASTSGGDLFRKTPETNTNDNPHCELMNNFFREFMLNKSMATSSPVKMQLNTSLSSISTVKVEEWLSS